MLFDVVEVDVPPVALTVDIDCVPDATLDVPAAAPTVIFNVLPIVRPERIFIAVPPPPPPPAAA
jgi:hypothetical protein